MIEISDILGYITDFYFQKSLKEINQMVSFNEKYDDCYVCPMS